MSSAVNKEAEIRLRISELGSWFHNIDLAGVQTAPNHFLGDYPACKWRHLQGGIPLDLTGKSVLDVGCNAGFYALEMKKRGAKRVVGIDSDARYLEQAKFAAEISAVDIDFHQMDVYDVQQLGERFDLVLFMGVLYHLRHPLLALDLLYQHAVKDLLIVQSLLRGARTARQFAEDYGFEDFGVFHADEFPRMYFVEHRYAGDPSNWWIPNRSCVEAMLRSAGFRIIGRPEEEAYICTRRQSG